MKDTKRERRVLDNKFSAYSKHCPGLRGSAILGGLDVAGEGRFRRWRGGAEGAEQRGGAFGGSALARGVPPWGEEGLRDNGRAMLGRGVVGKGCFWR